MSQLREGVVICLGEVCLDYIAHTDSYPRQDTKSVAAHSVIGGGGAAANVAVAFARLAAGKAATRLITRVGRDPAGVSVLAEVEAEGVELPLREAAEAAAEGAVRAEPTSRCRRAGNGLAACCGCLLLWLLAAGYWLLLAAAHNFPAADIKKERS